MTDKSRGTTPQGRPATEPSRQAAVLPLIIQQGDGNVKLATQAEVEQFLGQAWDEPAFVVPSHIGGIGPAYYARSEGHWMPAVYNASGWHLDLALAECDYRKEYPR